MIKRRVVPFLLIGVLAGCGHPLVPKSALAPSRVTSIAPSPTRPADIGSNGPVLGVNLYALSNYSTVQVTSDGERMIPYIRNVLHADAIDIVWNFYAPSAYSDIVETTSSTLSSSNVAILTKIAKRYHLLVEYRPLIMIRSDHPWEGSIKPSNPDLWFDSYYKRELPYLRVAQKYSISEFVAATEMGGLNSSSDWPHFFSRIGKVYHGVISYAAHQSNYFPPKTELLPVSYLGVDMYRALDLPSSASAAQVTAKYESFFSRIPTSVLRRTAIDETGIQARAGAYQRPSSLYIKGSLDEAVQANWFKAACRTVKKYNMRGVFFWKVDLTDYPITHPASSLSTFEGKEGAKAIAACATTLNS